MNSWIKNQQTSLFHIVTAEPRFLNVLMIYSLSWPQPTNVDMKNKYTILIGMVYLNSTQYGQMNLNFLCCKLQITL